MAGKLARTDEEKTQVLRLQASIAEIDRLQQGKLDRDFLQNLAALTARINGLHAGSSDLVVQSLSTELRSLMEESQGVSQSVEQQAKPLQAKLASIEKSKSVRRAMDVHLDRLTTSVGRVDAYKSELESFGTQFRDTARANIFKRISLESELWRQVDDWNEFIRRWNTAGIASVSAEAARQLNKDGEAILKEYGNYPVAKTLRGKASHLNAIGRRESESGEKLQASLNELFTDPLVVGLWMIEEKTDEGETRRYYPYGTALD